MRKKSGFLRLKKLILCMLCLLMVQGTVGYFYPPEHVQAATVKKGLKKEGKYYYYYVNGKKAKNTWKTVKSYKYYFGSNGRAYMASDLKKTDGYTKNVTVKKIGKYYYGFDRNGHMVKSGYYNDPLKYDSNGDSLSYYFDKYGHCNFTKSRALRKAGAYGANGKSLEKILGKPKSKKKLNSCSGEPGNDYQWNYANIYVTFHEYPNGRRTVFGIFPR